jgi:hypothetical protein
MRLIMLTLAVATLGMSSAQRLDPPRPLVILVHGRGQLDADTAEIRREWKADLDAGLIAAGDQPLRDEDVRLAWYADVLDPESDAECPVTADDSARIGFAEFTRELFALVRFEDTTADTRDARRVLSDAMYVMDPPKRCAAQERVEGIVEAAAANRPVVIVAYSLGALVAYESLRSAPASLLRNVRLVTIGSPMGVPLLRDVLLDGARPRLPDGISSWVNVYDPDDALSARLRLSGDTARFRDRATTLRNEANPHEVSHYLRDRATADAVRQALHEPF